MRNFKYLARDREGKAHEGFLRANDEAELRRALRGNDLFLTVVEGGAKEAPDSIARLSRNRFGRDKISAQDMVIAMRQLSTMIRSGLPLVQALEIVGAQTTKPALVVAFNELGESVVRGEPLSAAMRKHPDVFSTLVLALVEAGEAAGTLESTLEVAAKQLDREAVLRQKVSAATFYPKLVVVSCGGTILGMMTFVVPTFSRVYAGLHAKLPGPTLMLIAISEGFLRYWWLGVLACIGIVRLYRHYASTQSGRRRLDILSLRLPVLGHTYRQIAIARFIQTFGGALSGGIPILKSLAISANTAGNVAIRDAVIAAAHNVRDGASIATELDRTGQFPVMVVRMVGAGELSGNLEQMLEEISKFYERDVEISVDRLTRLIEPMMTILVGVIVLLVLLALYLPIFNLGKIFNASH